MKQARHKIVMIDLLHPCTACVIADNLLRESLGKVQKARADVEVEIVALSHPRELARYPAVEVEKMPLLIIDDEQVSAGSFLTPRQIIALLGD
ncbi:MAG TPA: thioredoxin family protein [Clostridia bacterium]|nr:thioredoxin family protein [Clostridia bacterium]